MTSTKRIIIIAGEASGDMHAAHLIRSIRQLNPHIEFSGLGGSEMTAAGVHIYEDITKYAVIGAIEILKHLSEFKRLFYLILNKIKEEKPDAVIFVDYPGFNLRLAKTIRAQGIKTKLIYYISPKVWAWKKNRVHLIKKYIDRMLVIFPFEKDFYSRFGMNVDFVGNPLLETVHPSLTKNEVFSLLQIKNKKLTIGLLPGSRYKEIENLLPPMLKAAEILKKEFQNIQFIIAKAQTIGRDHLLSHLKNHLPLNVKISELSTYDTIYACDMCMVASGTATLETALLGKPFVLVYKTNFLTWLIAKIVVKIKYIGLTNIILNKNAIPELIQFNASPQKIAATIKEIITNEIRLNEMKEDLRHLRSVLRSDIDRLTAAKIVIEEINRN